MTSHHVIPCCLWIIYQITALAFAQKIVFPTDTTTTNRPFEEGNSSNETDPRQGSINRGCPAFVGGQGRCIPYEQCEAPFEDEFIARRSVCGFYQRKPLICCPTSSGRNIFPSLGPFNIQQPNFFGGPINFPSNDDFFSFFRPQESFNFFRPQQNVYFPGPFNFGQQGFGQPGFGPPGFGNGFQNNRDRYSGAPQGGNFGSPGGLIAQPAYNTPPQRPPQPECGLTNSTQFRIVGGKEATPGAWPWLALLFVDIHNSGYRAPLCGGALITPLHVITAAHCTITEGRRLAARAFVVRLGEHDYLSSNDGATPIDIPAQEVIPHPQYSNTTYENDIAIIRLQHPVPLRPGISLICLPDNDGSDAIYSGKYANIAGWGELYYGGPASSVLQETRIPLQTLETCKDAFRRTKIRFNDKYLCAGSLAGDRDTCRGDSGGPLMYFDQGRFYVIGITSFGRRCAEKGYPGSYTRVAKFVPWISQYLN